MKQIAVAAALILFACMPAAAHKAIIRCTERGPEPITLINVWEIDFDRATIRKVETAPSAIPGPELHADITEGTITWHYLFSTETIDRHTRRYVSDLYDAAHDPAWQHWSGRCR
jgi:hypothetical protein